MLSRRNFLSLAAAAATAAPAQLTPKERVDRALTGQDVDRTPFTFWHHFGLEKLPGERHAAATLEFHRKYRTDLVKVMSDYPYPKPEGKWYEPRVVANPFPEQLNALQMIREELAGKVYFVETIFNSWNQAAKISSKEEVMRLMREDPRSLLEALEAIAESQANHAKKAIAAGAAGIFLAIDNAQRGILTEAEYATLQRAVRQADSGAGERRAAEHAPPAWRQGVSRPLLERMARGRGELFATPAREWKSPTCGRNTRA